MASRKVIVNSFKILAWQFNLLLHACGGGAALSKSSYKSKLYIYIYIQFFIKLEIERILHTQKKKKRERIY